MTSTHSAPIWSERRAPEAPSLPPPEHRRLLDGEWWRTIPAWRDVSRKDFLDHRWQLRNSLAHPDKLAPLLGSKASPEFLEDMRDGFLKAPMQLRVTPYILGLIDWRNPKRDPLRRQFIPLGSEHEVDHPMGTLDCLEEQRDAVAPGLTHRYPDKVLFLALDVCPVYCRFCTRSYSIGSAAGGVDKLDFHPSADRWDQAFAYLKNNPQVEDVVVSGGDLYLLNHKLLRSIGERLLEVDHIRRIRFATKGLAVMPQKILTDHEWVDAILDTVETGRSRGVHVCVHTHFNHPKEITSITTQAVSKLFQAGVVVRNQSVLLRGVNDDPETMTQLVRRLGHMHVQPYYVYVHDMVPGVECLRTTLAEAIEIEKQVRGQTAGFNTPTFVCDAYGGGGKRALNSFEIYDRHRGIAVYRSPVVDAGRAFFYFDPLRALDQDVQAAWQSKGLRRDMIDETVERSGL